MSFFIPMEQYRVKFYQKEKSSKRFLELSEEQLEKLAQDDSVLNRKAENKLKKIDKYKGIKEDRLADIDALKQEIQNKLFKK